jgi:glycosyltransferase involved in cell wall biosynthesis
MGDYKTIKVCHIIPSHYPYLAAPLEYTRILAKMGVRVNVYAIGRPGELPTEILNNIDVRRIFIKKASRFSINQSLRFTRFILDQIKVESFDVAHVYPYRGCGLLPILGRKFVKNWLLDIRSANVSSTGWVANLADRVTRLESMSFDVCSAITPMVGRNILGLKRKFDIHPIGVNMTLFKPDDMSHVNWRNRFGYQESDIVVVYSGKLEPQRRLDNVIQAFARACHEFPCLKLLMVGGGSALDMLSLMASRLGIAEQVRFTGQVPYQDVTFYIAAADIGLAYIPNSSQYDEQPPLKTLEFLASGLATIATNTIGNRMYIQHGQNGFLVDDNQEAIKEALVKLGKDEHYRQKLHQAARNSVEEYDWENIVAERIYPSYLKMIAPGW